MWWAVEFVETAVLMVAMKRAVIFKGRDGGDVVEAEAGGGKGENGDRSGGGYLKCDAMRR